MTITVMTDDDDNGDDDDDDDNGDDDSDDDLVCRRCRSAAATRTGATVGQNQGDHNHYDHGDYDFFLSTYIYGDKEKFCIIGFS